VNQAAVKSIRDLHDALIEFSEAYDYFGHRHATKVLVSFAVRARCYLKLAEYYLSSDKRVIKGPGAPSRKRESYQDVL
jgi:hypothetical protein